MIGIEGDSAEYEYITEGVELSKDVFGLCIELGVRRGMGTKTIMDAIKAYCPDKVSVAVDPYGNIEYFHKENEKIRLDYTNSMRYQCMQSLNAYADEIGVHFIPIVLEDTEFFKRYSDGVPMYRGYKSIINEYSFIHFDAPHAVAEIKEEIDFFHPRTKSGAVFCFDDVVGFYPHDEEIEPYLFALGYKLIKKGGKKANYIKL
jgi:hypothetical protein